MQGFADYYGVTNIHPMGVAALVLLSLLTLTLSRRNAFAPLIVGACTVPMAQRLIIGGADFTILRILVLVGLARVLMRQEYHFSQVNRLDLAVLAWVLIGSLLMSLHHGTLGAIINRIGWSFDVLGAYFLARVLIRDFSDLSALARVLALASVPIAVAFIMEWSSSYNMFSVFGGVAAETWVRDGRLRCQGAFAHPILAGTFWAAAMPLIWTLWYEGKTSRRLAIAGSICSLVIVVTCASSTPVLSVMVACLGLAAFRFRAWRTHLWVFALVCLIGLHVVMKAPVWHLMARVDIVGGSTGWHRYIILDTFINHFSDWYLTGNSNPLAWGVWQMRDITNQYVLEGLRGGLLTLIAFVAVLLFAFANVGRHLRATRRATYRTQVRTWMLGVAIFVHAVTFFGVSYFGQMTIMLYLQLALVGSLTQSVRFDQGESASSEAGTGVTFNVLAR